MQFSVDADSGAAVSGWVVPDNPGVVPRITVAVDDAPAVTIEANQSRADIRDLGMHRTGQVGFVVDERLCPGLAAAKSVQIWETDTQTLIFGRFDSERHVKLKFLYYELSAMPQVRINASMQRHFAMTYDAIERFSFDSLFAIVNNQFAQSIYLCGRPQYKRYRELLANRDFAIVTMLRDPYEELAERLLFARYATQPDRSRHLLRHLSGLGPLVQLASTVEIARDESILTAFRNLTDDHERVLANPFVRALACDINEQAERKHVGIALENLASMNIVGLRQRFDTFKSMLQELLGVDLLDQGSPIDVSWVPEFAAKLARVDRVKSLLALDVMLYNLAREAIGKAVAQS